MWESELLTSDAIGRLMEFWGFNRSLGRIWTVLYLQDEPLTAHDLRDRLHMSAGAVSMAIKELSHWGVVKKVWIQGSRRDHFVAESNLWKMITRVFQERERVEIVEAIDQMERALAFLDQKIKRGSAVDKRRAQDQKARIKRLLDLARLGHRLVTALVDKAHVDASPLVKFLLGDHR
jgi:DNA-binding transcriptional regulator GbsR (MarR family)